MSYVNYMSYVNRMSYVSFFNYLIKYFMSHIKSLEIAWNQSKNCLNCFKYNSFVLKKFQWFFVNI